MESIRNPQPSSVGIGGSVAGSAPTNLEGELDDVLKWNLKKSQSTTVHGEGGHASRRSSAVAFDVFKTSIAHDSQYHEFVEEVKFVEPDFKVKRVVCPQGKMMLSALNDISRRIEVMAMLPEIMSRLVFGDHDLENVLGEESVEAILRLFFLQAHWIDYRNTGEPPFQAFGSNLDEMKKRLQKGAKYPPPRHLQKQASFRILLQHSKKQATANEEEGGEDEEEEDEEEEENLIRSIPPAPTPSSFFNGSGSLLSLLSPTGSISDLSGDWIRPTNLNVRDETYMMNQVEAAYRQVFRLLTANENGMEYLANKIPPEVTQAVKVFYSQIQLLEALMYAKFLMTPEEEIQQRDNLKRIWIKEQRLLRQHRTLEDEFEEIGISKENLLRRLNQSINTLIAQIDNINFNSRYELNKLIAEANKQDLMNTKKFDQNLQQLDGTFQAALKFASQLRTKYDEIEREWKQDRVVLEDDLEGVIGNYDLEMGLRQEAMDELGATIKENATEIDRLETEFKSVELRYGKMVDEKNLINARKKKKKKKGKKGKKGSKKKRKGSKGKKKGQSKGKGKGKTSKSKGSKKGKKKSKKKGSLPATEGEENESEYEESEEEDGEEEEEQILAVPLKVEKKKKKEKIQLPLGLPSEKKKKKGKSKGKGKKEEKVGAAQPTTEAGKENKLEEKEKGGLGEKEEENDLSDDHNTLLTDDDEEDNESEGEEGDKTNKIPEANKASSGKGKKEKSPGKRGKKNKKKKSKKIKKKS